MTVSTMTLLQLRRLVATRLQDWYGSPHGDDAAGTLTTGGTTTAIDTARTEGVDFFKDAFFVTTAPTAVQYARVSAWDSSAKKWTFAKTLTALSIGDRYEVYRKFSPVEYLRAINEAIRRISTICRLEQASDTSLTLAANQTEYTIPSAFHTLYRVSVEDYTVTGLFRELSATDWDVRVGDGVLVLQEDIPGYLPYGTVVTSTRRLKLEGAAALTASLALETDTTAAPPDFVVPAAAAWLLRSVAQGKRDFQGREETLQMLVQEAQAAFALDRPAMRHKNARRVRQV